MRSEGLHEHERFSRFLPAEFHERREVLRDVLLGEWTEQELRHYAQLKAKLEQLKSVG